jgi:hypothetical protein
VTEAVDGRSFFQSFLTFFKDYAQKKEAKSKQKSSLLFHYSFSLHRYRYNHTTAVNNPATSCHSVSKNMDKDKNMNSLSI